MEKFWGENVRSTPTSITSSWIESTESHVILGGGVAVCLLLSAHRAVIFVIAQLSRYNMQQRETEVSFVDPAQSTVVSLPYLLTKSTSLRMRSWRRRGDKMNLCRWKAYSTAAPAARWCRAIVPSSTATHSSQSDDIRLRLHSLPVCVRLFASIRVSLPLHVLGLFARTGKPPARETLWKVGVRRTVTQYN